MNLFLLSQDSQGAREKVVALLGLSPSLALGCWEDTRLGIFKAWLKHTTPPRQKVGKNS